MSVIIQSILILILIVLVVTPVSKVSCLRDSLRIWNYRYGFGRILKISFTL